MLSAGILTLALFGLIYSLQSFLRWSTAVLLPRLGP